MRLHLLALAIPLAAPAAAWAEPIVVVRDTDTFIYPGDPRTFAGARFEYTNFFDLTGTGRRDFIFTFLPASPNINVGADSGVTISPAFLGASPGTVAFSASSEGLPGALYFINYDGPASAVPGESFILQTVVEGRHALVFSGGGSGAGDGQTFVSSVHVFGDWSAPDVHRGPDANPAYTVEQAWAFDGGFTRFSVRTDYYVAGSNPSISFTLLGDPVAVVPTPGALLIFGTLLAGLASLRRPR
jgi:hypothetical protein